VSYFCNYFYGAVVKCYYVSISVIQNICIHSFFDIVLLFAVMFGELTDEDDDDDDDDKQTNGRTLMIT